MLQTIPFKLFAARIAAELERARADCETQTDLMLLRQAQGKVTAFRTALDLPGMILNEMKAGPKVIPVPRPSGRGNASADGEGLVSGGR